MRETVFLTEGKRWAEAWRHQIIVLLSLGSVELQCSLSALGSQMTQVDVALENVCFKFSRFLVGQLDFQEGESPGQPQAWLPHPWHGLSHWPHHREEVGKKTRQLEVTSLETHPATEKKQFQNPIFCLKEENNKDIKREINLSVEWLAKRKLRENY